MIKQHHIYNTKTQTTRVVDSHVADPTDSDALKTFHGKFKPLPIQRLDPEPHEVVFDHPPTHAEIGALHEEVSAQTA